MISLRIISGWMIVNFLTSFPPVHNQLTRPPPCSCSLTIRCSLARVNENFVLWDVSRDRCSQSSRREPARQDLLSRLNIVARYSRQDSRKFPLTFNPTDLTCNTRGQFLALILRARFTGGMHQGIKTDENTVLWFVTLCSLVGKSFRVFGTHILVSIYTALQAETWRWKHEFPLSVGNIYLPTYVAPY